MIYRIHEEPIPRDVKSWMELNKTDCIALNPDGTECGGVVLATRDQKTLEIDGAYCIKCGQRYSIRETEKDTK